MAQSIRFRLWLGSLAFLGALLALPPCSRADSLSHTWQYPTTPGGSQINATVVVYNFDLVNATYFMNFSGTVQNPECCNIPGNYFAHDFVDLFIQSPPVETSAMEILGATGSPDVTF